MSKVFFLFNLCSIVVILAAIGTSSIICTFLLHKHIIFHNCVRLLYERRCLLGAISRGAEIPRFHRRARARSIIYRRRDISRFAALARYTLRHFTPPREIYKSCAFVRTSRYIATGRPSRRRRQTSAHEKRFSACGARERKYVFREIVRRHVLPFSPLRSLPFLSAFMPRSQSAPSPSRN